MTTSYPHRSVNTRRSEKSPGIGDSAEDRLTPAARRILDVASELFYRRGIHAIGVDTIAAESGITKRTLYDRFGSKDALVVAYLRERDHRWRELVAAHVDREHDDARRVLAPFDALEEWLTSGSRGCGFVNAFAELPDTDHPARQVVGDSKRWLRELFGTLLVAAQARQPDLLARQLLTLHEGAIIAFAVMAERTAVQDARAAATVLLAQ
jgi:AcrR family transcriptional regulator